MSTEYCYVEYHSDEWALLVETGWVTVFVDSANQAYMLHESA